MPGLLLDLGRMDRVIGVDGGGSHTRACVADPGGRVLGTGRAGCSNHFHAGAEGTAAAIAAAVGEAMQAAGMRLPAKVLYLGLAGVAEAADRAPILEAVGKRGLAETVGLGSDLHIALSGGLGGRPGIALIAGTGSSCYGRDAAGRTAKVGGCGALADDAGGACWMARRALELAVREADGRLPESGLKTAVYGFLGIADWREFLRRHPGAGPRREDLARLCPLIVDLWKQGNAPAAEVAEAAIRELALLVATTARRLALESPEVVLAGGLARSGPPFQPRLEEVIGRAVPGARCPEPVLPPVGGAVLEAITLAGGGTGGDVVENVRQTIGRSSRGFFVDQNSRESAD